MMIWLGILIDAIPESMVIGFIVSEYVCVCVCVCVCMYIRTFACRGLNPQQQILHPTPCTHTRTYMCIR